MLKFSLIKTSPLVKYLKSACLIFLILSWVVKGLIPGFNTIGSDFPNYYVSSKIFLEQKENSLLYDDGWFNKKSNTIIKGQLAKFSSFPPITALLAIPLTPFSPLTAKRIWTIINVLLLGFTIILMHKIFNWKIIDCSLLIFASGRALWSQFIFGQFYLLLVFLLFLIYFWYQKKQFILIGITLATVIILKIFPVVFLFGFIILKEKKVILSTLISGVLLLIIQLSLFSIEINLHYYLQILPAHLSGKLSMQSPFSVYFQSWESLLRNLFVYHPKENLSPLFNWSVGKTIFKLIIYGFTIIGLGYTLLKTLKVKDKNYKFIIFGIIPLAFFTLLPASATYHFLLLTLPLFFLMETFKNKQWVLLTFYLSISIIDAGLFKSVSTQGIFVLIHYPRLWIVSILYIYSLYLYHKTTFNTARI